METTDARRVLIVANRTAGTPKLLDEVRRLAKQRASTFTLLIPDAPQSQQTDWTLEAALPLLERAAGGPVEALTGGEDPLEVIRRVVADHDYDQIVISTLPARTSKWLRRDLPNRVKRLGTPVIVVTPEQDPYLKQRMRQHSGGPMGF